MGSMPLSLFVLEAGCRVEGEVKGMEKRKGMALW